MCPSILCRGTVVEEEQELWAQISETLNAMSGGATKDPARWKRSWYDAYVKRKTDKTKKNRNHEKKKKKQKKKWNFMPANAVKRKIGACVTEIQKQGMIEFFNQHPHALDKKYFYAPFV